MSRPQKFNPDDNKISKDSLAKGLESTLQCVPIVNFSSEKSKSTTIKSSKRMPGTNSVGNIIKHDNSGLKQKLVNKVKSWSSKECKSLLLVDATASPIKSDSNLSHIGIDIQNLNLTESSFEDKLYKSDLIRAKDSLENLLGPRSDTKTVSGECRNIKSYMDPTSSKSSPHSTSFLGGSSSVDNTAKTMTWDPWNKLGRKNKKEKKKKPDKSPSHTNETKKNTAIVKSKDHTGGDEPKSNISGLTPPIDSDLSENCEYHPYRSKKKSVTFVNEVVVVYFTGDEVLNRATEPLKKELDQQIRNKEMRRGHIPCTLTGISQSNGNEELFPSIWYKR